MFSKNAVLFLLLTCLGAIYLNVLGISIWRGVSWGVDFKTETIGDAQILRLLFSTGFLVAAGDPKTIVFFTALFPQFLRVNEAAFSQMALMVILARVIAFVVAMI
ncbi:MAG: LysE family transporter [Pikeienuella sp.]